LERGGGSAGDNRKQAIEQPTKNDQKAGGITLGRNCPISDLCLQITASTSSNTSGIAGVKP